MFEFELSSLGDAMLEEQVKQIAKEYGISELELIKQYIKTGIENEQKHEENQGLSDEELERIFREDVEEDKKMGRYKKQGNFEELIEKIKVRNNGNW